MSGERVLDKHLREKEQEKRHDPAVDEKEKGNKSNCEDKFTGRANNLSVVAILIATVTSTAGFTLPGGLNQDKGSPILKYNAAFIAFVITDSLSFVLSTSVVLIVFVAILGNRSVPEEVSKQLLDVFSELTEVAMGFMIIAFGTGLYAILGVSKGFGVVTLLIVLSFFVIVIIVIAAIMLKNNLISTGSGKLSHLSHNV